MCLFLVEYISMLALTWEQWVFLLHLQKWAAGNSFQLIQFVVNLLIYDSYWAMHLFMFHSSNSFSFMPHIWKSNDQRRFDTRMQYDSLLWKRMDKQDWRRRLCFACSTQSCFHLLHSLVTSTTLCCVMARKASTEIRDKTKSKRNEMIILIFINPWANLTRKWV